MTFNLTEVHNTSVGLLTYLEEQETPVGLSAVALLMSIGRLLSPTPMSDEQEIAFIKDALDWGGAYFAEGEKN